MTTDGIIVLTQANKMRTRPRLEHPTHGLGLNRLMLTEQSFYLIHRYVELVVRFAWVYARPIPCGLMTGQTNRWDRPLGQSLEIDNALQQRFLVGLQCLSLLFPPR